MHSLKGKENATIDFRLPGMCCSNGECGLDILYSHAELVRLVLSLKVAFLLRILVTVSCFLAEPFLLEENLSLQLDPCVRSEGLTSSTLDPIAETFLLLIKCLLLE
jgi:hypothetical protein